MTVVRLKQWARVLAVAALCLPAMFGGLSLLRFSLAEGADAYRRLVGDPFVGAAASLELAIVEAEPAARAHDLEASLARAPLNAGAWLDLAIARRAAGEDFARVVEALNFSLNTGPREAQLMTGRVEFALPLWAEIPGELKARLTDDLVGVAPYLTPQEQGNIAALVGLQAPEDARSICLELGRRGAVDVAAYGC